MKPHKRRLVQKIKRKLFQPFYLILAIVLLCSHDLYLKMDSYFLAPGEEATLSLYNGTFEKSENIITRDRIQDASVVTQAERVAINPEQWKDLDTTVTQFTFTAGESGTYVAGVSTKARNIELSAGDFNDYLRHDGVLDMLEYRTDNNLLDQDAVESYEKHVKAIYQVGDTKTADWSTVLGYPIEFVPQGNPYDTYTGETLDVALLLDGEPLANQLVYANYLTKTEGHSHGELTHEHDGTTHSHEAAVDSTSHTHDTSEDGHSHDDSAEEHTHEDGEHTHTHDNTGQEHSHTHEDTAEEHTHDNSTHSHTHDDGGHTHSHDDAEPQPEASESKEEHTHTSGQQLTTNEQGIVSIDLPEDGIYYLRTIHMVTITDSDELTHRSKWATLSFEVSHKHGEDTHTHDDHEEEDGLPIWAFVLGSMLIVGILFLVFRKTSS